MTPKVTQKYFFEVLVLCVSGHIKAITDPLGTWGGGSKPLKSAWGVFLRKSKIDPKSAFSAGGDKGSLAARGGYMRLVSTK